MYSSVDKDGIIRNPKSQYNGKTWISFLEEYKISNDDVNKALANVKNKNVAPPSSSGTTASGTTASGNTVNKKVATKKVAPPKEMGKITDFQDWLDGNKSDAKLGAGKGWATGYTGGVINQGKNGGGYGSYGPRTQKAWATYGKEYLTKDVGALAKKGQETADQEINQQFNQNTETQNTGYQFT